MYNYRELERFFQGDILTDCRGDANINSREDKNSKCK